MRLITHNMLSCNIKGVTKGFPLGIEAEKVETKEADFNPDFLRNIFSKLEWKAFHDAAVSLGINDIPEQVEPAVLEDEAFLQKFHHALLEDVNRNHEYAFPVTLSRARSGELHILHSRDQHLVAKTVQEIVHLEEGALVCPETGRKFPVVKGVPNMLLHEDEV